MNHLNKYYRDLQQRAEEQHRDDLLAWEWAHESEANATALNTGVKVYAPHEKQPISDAVRKLQEDERRSAEAESELYENYRANEDANEYEVNQKIY